MPPKRQRPHSPSPDASSCFEFDARVYPQAGPTPAKKKKGQPGHDEPVEKRLKLFKKACPKATEERMGRVMSQRFFCVARERTGEISEEFKVLGSTGNAYTIKIGKTPSCNCPDGMKGNHCKHIVRWYQSALLSSELRAIFAHARPAPRSQIEERVSRLYKIAMGEANAVDLEEDRGEGGSGGLVPRKRVPAKGDACPICCASRLLSFPPFACASCGGAIFAAAAEAFNHPGHPCGDGTNKPVLTHRFSRCPLADEDFTPKSEAGLVFCLSLQGCGNALHSECFANWARTATPKWADTVPTPNAIAGPSRSSEGYANFAAQAGISGKRDTSSYYRGPRRGARWRSGYGRHGEYEFEEEDAEEWARSGYGYGN
ncbi:SPOSA6832_01053 [Sporobolomyces salmonicolor]|uniref:SPOSA6832_01053-mRNA-1:cds n=1 Tax=Sporidiobolus salmonicolor TaxID=5005 RepID=A0A0D6EIA8_SPOSA|nr:SPOSA6832_01053 [Sporobolomyces salmonicolor]